MARPRDEVRRERDDREKAARTERRSHDEPPHANGHDRVRKVAVVGLNDLGVTERQDNMVGGIIGEGQFGVVYGESGSGKSFLSFDMAMHYALKWEWMGHKIGGEGACVYIAAEGRGGWANRVDAFCQHHNLDEEARAMCPFAFIIEGVNLGRTGNGDITAVVVAITAFAARIGVAVKLVVVDTMARATPGSNENDAGDMGAFVANMDTIRRATGASVLVVHHSGKNANLGARGHSSLRAACDTELEVERTDAGRVLRIRKSRDGADADEQAFTLQVVDIGRDADGQAITSCIIASADMVDAGKSKSRRRKPLAAWELALEYLDRTLIDQPVASGHGNVRCKVADWQKALERASILPAPDVNPKTGKATSTHRTKWFKIQDNCQRRKVIEIEGDLCWRIDV